eukprot:6184970-Pleurochrysis_carterae.AAC.2
MDGECCQYRWPQLRAVTAPFLQERGEVCVRLEHDHRALDVEDAGRRLRDQKRSYSAATPVCYGAIPTIQCAADKGDCHDAS